MKKVIFASICALCFTAAIASNNGKNLENKKESTKKECCQKQKECCSEKCCH